MESSLDDTKIRRDKCCMRHCKSLHPDLMHKFPKNSDLQNEWVLALKAPYLTILSHEQLYRRHLCSRHFRPDDYHVGKPCLNKNAVPSLNLQDLSQLDTCMQPLVMSKELKISESYDTNIRRDKCCMRQCKSWHPDLMHKFPKNSDLQHEWVLALKAKYLTILSHEQLAWRHLCSRHFRPDDYHVGKPCLNKNAVPSLNLQDLSQLDTCMQPLAMSMDLQLSENVKSTHNNYTSLEHELLFEKQNIHMEVLQMGQTDAARQAYYDLQFYNRTLEITYSVVSGAMETLQLDVLWLRSQCLCTACYDAKTNARKVTIFELPTTPELKVVFLQKTPLAIHLTWSDDHKSSYPLLQLIEQHRATGRSTNYSLWCSKLPVSSTDFNLLKCPDLNFLTEYIMWIALERLQRVGILVIERPKCSEAQSLQKPSPDELLLRHLFPHLPHTGVLQYERRFDFNGSRQMTTIPPPHTNCTFVSSDCGLQVLSIQSHTQLTLADGFDVAKQLQPETFRFLSQFTVSNVYENSSQLEYTLEVPLITLAPGSDDVLERIHCAPYHLAASMAQGQFVGALKEFTELLNNPKQQIALNLMPDMIVILDNWRICWRFDGCSVASPFLNCMYVPRKYYISGLQNNVFSYLD